MREIIFFAFVFLISAFEKINSLTLLNIDYSDIDVILSTTYINLPLSVLSPETTTNSEIEFTINDTRKDLIEQIKITQLLSLWRDPLYRISVFKTRSVVTFQHILSLRN